MFVHSFKYAMKTMLRNKTALIWTLLFPIALGTFMYMAFGNMYQKDMVFNVVPVAVVKSVDNKAFETMLTALSKEGDDQLLEVSYMTLDEAEEALDKEEVKGIVLLAEEIKLVVSKSSYETTVLKSIMDEYAKQEKLFADIAMTNPAALVHAVEALTEERSFFTEKTTSDGNQNPFTNYFYAVFAMSCLFASFAAIEKVGNLQANVSALGMRRALNPNSKMIVILAEFLSMLIVQFLVEVIALGYFYLIGIDFGTNYLHILGIFVFGSCIGIALGIMIGAIPNMPEAGKSGICILISMVLSVMADLVASGVKDAIEHVAPIINRLNPAALIVDSFYALNIYDTYERYFRNLGIMGIMTVVLLGISFLILRRNKYASV